MKNVTQAPESEPRLSQVEWKALEQNWLQTVVTDHSDTESLFWFARKGDYDHPTVKIAAKNSPQAWYRLGEHVKNHGPL